MNMLHQHLLVACALAGLSVAFVPAARAQSGGYGQAYQNMIQSTPGMSAGTNRYLYDKYYRSNPNVSPYISGAVLGGNQSGTAYTTVVRPDLEARAATQTAQSQYIAKRKLEGNVGYTANPGATFYGAPTSTAYGKPVPAGRRNSGSYQNHWYGGWNK